VDDDFHIVVLVDLDWVSAALIDVVARSLSAIGVNLTIPGLSTQLQD
jgi:hypothetical protein